MLIGFFGKLCKFKILNFGHSILFRVSANIIKSGEFRIFSPKAPEKEDTKEVTHL